VLFIRQRGYSIKKKNLGSPAKAPCHLWHLCHRFAISHLHKTSPSRYGRYNFFSMPKKAEALPASCPLRTAFLLPVKRYTPDPDHSHLQPRSKRRSDIHFRLHSPYVAVLPHIHERLYDFRSKLSQVQSSGTQPFLTRDHPLTNDLAKGQKRC
jgi:hypothetical protein